MKCLYKRMLRIVEQTVPFLSKQLKNCDIFYVFVFWSLPYMQFIFKKYLFATNRKGILASTGLNAGIETN